MSDLVFVILLSAFFHQLENVFRTTFARGRQQLVAKERIRMEPREEEHMKKRKEDTFYQLDWQFK